MGIATLATAATAIGGAVISSKSSKKAVNATTQAADTSNEIALKIHNDNLRRLAPYDATGVKANRAASAMMGLEDGPQAAAPRAVSTPGASRERAYLDRNPDVDSHYDGIGAAERNWLNNNGYAGREGWARFHYEKKGQGEGRTYAKPVARDFRDLAG